MPLDPKDLPLILHQLGNLAQPVGYHIDKLCELKSDDPVFNQAIQALPARLNALNRTLERLRILSKPLELEHARVNLDSLLKSVWNEVAGMPEFKAVAIKWEVPEACATNADEYWLHLALHELFMNSAQAAASSKKASIAMQVHARENKWRIQLDDSGPGLPADCARGELFVTTRAETGAGLGLPIAQHILAAHAGALLFERSPAGGRVVVLLGMA
jgi:C4-dicarboxylate-specific signal transduction histidine kinase